MSEVPNKIFIVDDDESVRKALSRFFRVEGYEVETFDSAESFLAHPIDDQPGCVILDVHMPGKSGIELQASLTKTPIDLPIVFMTGVGDIPTSVQAMKAGAVDFLPKPVDSAQLLKTVQQAISNYQMDRVVLDQVREFMKRFEELTTRERQVMHLVVEGLLNKQIARRLEISEATVKVHRGRVMEKMNVGSVAELARLFERSGLDSQDQSAQAK